MFPEFTQFLRCASPASHKTPPTRTAATTSVASLTGRDRTPKTRRVPVLARPRRSLRGDSRSQTSTRRGAPADSRRGGSGVYRAALATAPGRTLGAGFAARPSWLWGYSTVGVKPPNPGATSPSGVTCFTLCQWMSVARARRGVRSSCAAGRRRDRRERRGSCRGPPRPPAAAAPVAWPAPASSGRREGISSRVGWSRI